MLDDRRGRGRLAVPVFLLATLLLGCPACTGGSSTETARGEASHASISRPRLVVLIVIDQFRADYIDRFRDRFGAHGFARLLHDGAHFTQCRFSYAFTETAPGHATIGTGATPDRHGIVANRWFDEQEGRVSAAVEDAAYPIVGGTSTLSGVSPRKMMGTTFGDELRRFTNGAAKSFGIDLKDRGSVLSVGHDASGAFWADRSTGRFVSSRFYYERLPAWVEEFNERRLPDRYYGRDWQVGGISIVNLSSPSGKPDPDFYGNLAATPYAHEVIDAFVRELIVREDLGADDVPDFLYIGMAAHDYLGHQVGPYHPAVEAMAIHSDALIADLLRLLDRRVGPDNYYLVLTADHGVAPSLEQSAERGLPAVALDERVLGDVILAALSARWGEDEWNALGHRGWTRLHFNREVLSRRRVSVAEAARVAGEAALGVGGVLGYVSPERSTLDARLTEAVRLNTYPGRSPDLTIVSEPFTLLAGGAVASHGTPHDYDTHVPLILLGPPFLSGAYGAPATPADIAPTLAAVLGIPAPSRATGRVLEEALASGR